MSSHDRLELARIAIARAKAHRAQHANFAPDRCRSGARVKCRKALVALGDGVGWAARLEMAGDGLRLYTVGLAALGLEHLKPWQSLLEPDAVGEIKRASLQVFAGPIWAKLEAGKTGCTHIHVLAHVAPIVQARVSKIYALDGLLAYLNKSPFPSGLEAEGFVLLAQDRVRLAGTRLPSLSFGRGIPRK